MSVLTRETYREVTMYRKTEALYVPSNDNVSENGSNFYRIVENRTDEVSRSRGYFCVEKLHEQKILDCFQHIYECADARSETERRPHRRYNHCGKKHSAYRSANYFVRP